MTSKTKIPRFKTEGQEAEWWDAHPEVIADLFLKARKEGKLRRLPVVPEGTQPVTLRLPVSDVEIARELAEKRGLPYQTLIKTLLHRALQRERAAG